MDPKQREADTKTFTEQETRLLRLYGKLPAKRDLLHQQLERRKYFDSGDFALSEANQASNIGVVQTGSEHPVRESISHPSSAVPTNSNVNQNADQQGRGAKSTDLDMKASHLNQEMSVDNGKACSNT